MREHSIERTVLQRLTLRAALLRGFEQAAGDLKLNVSQLMARVGIDQSLLSDPESRVSAIGACRLLELASEISGCGDFGLRVAMTQGFPDFGPLALLLREQPEVRSAINALSENLGVNTDVFSIKLMEDGVDPIISQNFHLSSLVKSRQMIELTCARLVQIIRQLIGETWSPKLVCFSHSESPIGMNDLSLFRCPIKYGCEFTGILLRHSDLECQPNGANEDLKRYAEAYLQTLKAKIKLRFDQRVANVIVGRLACGPISAEWVAAEIGITRRTLNRKLAVFGHSYSSILRIVREEKLTVLLRQEEKRLSEISFELGFHHPSAFSTWFQEIFFCTPSTWRKGQKNLRSHRGAPETHDCQNASDMSG